MNPLTPIENIVSPSGPRESTDSEGIASVRRSEELVMIYLRMVFSPMLENRMAKMMMTRTEKVPPEMVLYSASFLYLRSFPLGKKSKSLSRLRRLLEPVSYTHLTLPTIYSV